MRVDISPSSEMAVDRIEGGDHLINGRSVDINDRMDENHRGIGHIVVIAVEPEPLAAARMVLSEVDETVDPHVEQGRSHVRYLAELRWFLPARVGTGYETAFYDPVGPVSGARCRRGGEFKIEESHGEQSYPSMEPSPKMA